MESDSRRSPGMEGGPGWNQAEPGDPSSTPPNPTLIPVINSTAQREAAGPTAATLSSTPSPSSLRSHPLFHLTRLLCLLPSYCFLRFQLSFLVLPREAWRSTWTTPRPPPPFFRWLELVAKHGKKNMFTFSLQSIAGVFSFSFCQYSSCNAICRTWVDAF